MRGALTLNQSETDKTYEFKISFDYFRPVLFEVCALIINVAYFALPSMGACYGRSVAPPPSSKTKEKNVEVRGSSRLMPFDKKFMHH